MDSSGEEPSFLENPKISGRLKKARSQVEWKDEVERRWASASCWKRFRWMCGEVANSLLMQLVVLAAIVGDLWVVIRISQSEDEEVASADASLLNFLVLFVLSLDIVLRLLNEGGKFFTNRESVGFCASCQQRHLNSFELLVVVLSLLAALLDFIVPVGAGRAARPFFRLGRGSRFLANLFRIVVSQRKRLAGVIGRKAEAKIRSTIEGLLRGILEIGENDLVVDATAGQVLIQKVRLHECVCADLGYPAQPIGGLIGHIFVSLPLKAIKGKKIRKKNEKRSEEENALEVVFEETQKAVEEAEEEVSAAPTAPPDVNLVKLKTFWDWKRLSEDMEVFGWSTNVNFSGEKDKKKDKMEFRVEISDVLLVLAPPEPSEVGESKNIDAKARLLELLLRHSKRQDAPPDAQVIKKKKKSKSKPGLIEKIRNKIKSRISELLMNSLSLEIKNVSVRYEESTPIYIPPPPPLSPPSLYNLLPSKLHLPRSVSRLDRSISKSSSKVFAPPQLPTFPFAYEPPMRDVQVPVRSKTWRDEDETEEASAYPLKFSRFADGSSFKETDQTMGFALGFRLSLLRMQSHQQEVEEGMSSVERKGEILGLSVYCDTDAHLEEGERGEIPRWGRRWLSRYSDFYSRDSLTQEVFNSFRRDRLFERFKWAVSDRIFSLSPTTKEGQRKGFNSLVSYLVSPHAYCCSPLALSGCLTTSSENKELKQDSSTGLHSRGISKRSKAEQDDLSRFESRRLSQGSSNCSSNEEGDVDKKGRLQDGHELRAREFVGRIPSIRFSLDDTQVLALKLVKQRLSAWSARSSILSFRPDVPLGDGRRSVKDWWLFAGVIVSRSIEGCRQAPLLLSLRILGRKKLKLRRLFLAEGVDTSLEKPPPLGESEEFKGSFSSFSLEKHRAITALLDRSVGEEDSSSDELRNLLLHMRTEDIVHVLITPHLTLALKPKPSSLQKAKTTLFKRAFTKKVVLELAENGRENSAKEKEGGLEKAMSLSSVAEASKKDADEPEAEFSLGIFVDDISLKLVSTNKGFYATYGLVHPRRPPRKGSRTRIQKSFSRMLGISSQVVSLFNFMKPHGGSFGIDLSSKTSENFHSTRGLFREMSAMSAARRNLLVASLRHIAVAHSSSPESGHSELSVNSFEVRNSLQDLPILVLDLLPPGKTKLKTPDAFIPRKRKSSIVDGYFLEAVDEAPAVFLLKRQSCVSLVPRRESGLSCSIESYESCPSIGDGALGPMTGCQEKETEGLLSVGDVKVFLDMNFMERLFRDFNADPVPSNGGDSTSIAKRKAAIFQSDFSLRLKRNQTQKLCKNLLGGIQLTTSGGVSSEEKGSSFYEVHMGKVEAVQLSSIGEDTLVCRDVQVPCWSQELWFHASVFSSSFAASASGEELEGSEMPEEGKSIREEVQEDHSAGKEETQGRGGSLSQIHGLDIPAGDIPAQWPFLCSTAETDPDPILSPVKEAPPLQVLFNGVQEEASRNSLEGDGAANQASFGRDNEDMVLEMEVVSRGELWRVLERVRQWIERRAQQERWG